MPRKIRIDNRPMDIVEMTQEGLQAPHEHFGFYDMPAMYMPEMPAYVEPIQPEWSDMPIASTPQHAMHEPVIEPEPKAVDYNDCVMTQELFEFMMQQVIADSHADPVNPLDVHEVAEVNQIQLCPSVEPMGTMNGVPLEESIKEIENEISLAQNAPFEMQQMMFDQQMQVMDPFGPGPVM